MRILYSHRVVISNRQWYLDQILTESNMNAYCISDSSLCDVSDDERE